MNACGSVFCVSSKLAGVFFFGSVSVSNFFFFATCECVCVCACMELIDRLCDQ